MTRLDPSLAQEFEAALAWWQMAGVDCDFADDATAWLSDEPAAVPAKGADGTARRTDRSADEPLRPAAPRTAALTPPPPPAAIHRRAMLGDSPPADLAAFHRWWMEAPDLSPSRGFARVPPRGSRGASLMVLVPQPEAEDRERLLSGPQGQLLANILAAMGIEDSVVYIAATLPAHTPMADLPALASAGMDAVTLHHVGLAAPARLLAFGTGLAPMLGAPTDQLLHEVNHAGGKVPAIMSETLDALMDMPRLKARFWRRWMEWSAAL